MRPRNILGRHENVVHMLPGITGAGILPSKTHSRTPSVRWKPLVLLVLVLLIWYTLSNWLWTLGTSPKRVLSPLASSSSTSRGFHQNSDFVSQESKDIPLRVLICENELYYADDVDVSWSTEVDDAEFVDALESDSGQECCNSCAHMKSSCNAYFYTLADGICSLFNLVKQPSALFMLRQPPAAEEKKKEEFPPLPPPVLSTPSQVEESLDLHELGFDDPAVFDEEVKKDSGANVPPHVPVLEVSPVDSIPLDAPPPPASIPALPIEEEIAANTIPALPIEEEMAANTIPALPLEEEIAANTIPALPIEEEVPDLPIEEEEISANTIPDLPMEEEIPNLPVEEDSSLDTSATTDNSNEDEDDNKESSTNHENVQEPPKSLPTSVDKVPQLPKVPVVDKVHESPVVDKVLEFPGELEDSDGIETGSLLLLNDNEEEEEEKSEEVVETTPPVLVVTTKPPPKKAVKIDLSSLDFDLEEKPASTTTTNSVRSLDDLLSDFNLEGGGGDGNGNDDDEEDQEEDDNDDDESGNEDESLAQHSNNNDDSDNHDNDFDDLNSVSMGEVQLNPELNLKLSQLPISTILVTGAYSVTIADPFYSQKLSYKFFGRFRAVSEIHDYLTEFQASQSNAKWKVDFFSLGLSGEGKTIKAMEIGNPNRGKHVFIIGGLKGCDWIGPLATVHSIVSLMGRRRSTQALLDAVRFHFVPLVNVDGYHYSRRKTPATARHWCDNRRISGGGHGANLERNWGNPGESWGFGKEGKEGRKDKLGFQGMTGFSEPETQRIRDYIQHYMTGSGRVAVLHVRCCAGSISPPQPFGTRLQKVSNDFLVGINTMGNNLRADGNEYVIQKRDASFSPENTGQLIDWTYSMGADHSYAIELKAFSVATHNDRYQISPEPFMALCKELEIGLVTTVQLLLSQPITGSAPQSPYRPTVPAASKKTSTSSSAGKK